MADQELAVPLLIPTTEPPNIEKLLEEANLATANFLPNITNQGLTNIPAIRKKRSASDDVLLKQATPNKEKLTGTVYFSQNETVNCAYAFNPDEKKVE